MTEQHGKDSNGFAFEGKASPAHHDVDSGNVYGTAEGDRVEGSHAPDVNVRRALGGRTRSDEQERWLRDNDPNYNGRPWNG